MAKNKGLNFNVASDNVMYTNISKSKDGFNSARLVAKMGEKEYMSISYEWEGEGVPSFAMDLMMFMQAHDIKSNQVVAGFEDDEYMLREDAADGTKKPLADTTKKHMPKVCEGCGNSEEDCTCDGKKQLKKTKEKKGADKKA